MISLKELSQNEIGWRMMFSFYRLFQWCDLQAITVGSLDYGILEEIIVKLMALYGEKHSLDL